MNTCSIQKLYESKSIVFFSKWQKQNHKNAQIDNKSSNNGNSSSHASTNANDATQTRTKSKCVAVGCVCAMRKVCAIESLTHTTFNLWTEAHKLATSHAYEIYSAYFFLLCSILVLSAFHSRVVISFVYACVDCCCCFCVCCWFLASLHIIFYTILFTPVLWLLAQSHSLCPWRCWRSHIKPHVCRIFENRARIEVMSLYMLWARDTWVTGRNLLVVLLPASFGTLWLANKQYHVFVYVCVRFSLWWFCTQHSSINVPLFRM